MIAGLWYWAYLDDTARIHIKRYIDDKTIQNYEQMPWVLGIFEPFEAINYETAKAEILKKWNEIKKDFKGSFKNKVIKH